MKSVCLVVASLILHIGKSVPLSNQFDNNGDTLPEGKTRMDEGPEKEKMSKVEKSPEEGKSWLKGMMEKEMEGLSDMKGMTENEITGISEEKMNRLPDRDGIQGMEGMSGMGGIPGMGEVPWMPEMPGMGGMPGMGRMAGIPGMGEVPELPPFRTGNPHLDKETYSIRQLKFLNNMITQAEVMMSDSSEMSRAKIRPLTKMLLDQLIPQFHKLDFTDQLKTMDDVQAQKYRELLADTKMKMDRITEKLKEQ